MSLLTIAEAVALCISLLIAISIVHYTLRFGISPMPSSSDVRKELLNFLPPLDSGPIYELGSGFGTLAIPLAQQYPNLQIKGFEVSPVPYWIARVRARYLGLDNLQFVRKDFLSTDLSQAQLLVSYLYPEGMKKIAEKLLIKQRPKQYFLSHTFALPGYEPLKSGRASDLYRSPIYLYEIGAQTSASNAGEA